MKKYSTLNIQVQPRLLLFGTQQIFAELKINNRGFIFEDPLEAFESIYHLFNSTLDLKYPLAAVNVWKLIGELVFKSGEKKDLPSAVLRVLSIVSRDNVQNAG